MEGSDGLRRSGDWREDTDAQRPRDGAGAGAGPGTVDRGGVE